LRSTSFTSPPEPDLSGGLVKLVERKDAGGLAGALTSLLTDKRRARPACGERS
jgi:hypothetical protein